MKTPEVIKRAVAAGTEGFPLAYAAAKEWLEEHEGSIDDALKEDARIRAERAQDQASTATRMDLT